MNWFRRVERKIDEILAAVKQGAQRMSQQLDDLTAEVAAATTIEQSAVTLIQGLAAQLAAAGTDPAKLQALHDSLKASSDALAAAVAANTPAAPPATPPAAPPTT